MYVRVDFTRPLLDLYVEYNKIQPNDRDNHEWASRIIERYAPGYLDAERERGG